MHSFLSNFIQIHSNLVQICKTKNWKKFEWVWMKIERTMCKGHQFRDCHVTTWAGICATWIQVKPRRQDLKAMDLFLKARVSELLPWWWSCHVIDCCSVLHCWSRLSVVAWIKSSSHGASLNFAYFKFYHVTDELDVWWSSLSCDKSLATWRPVRPTSTWTVWPLKWRFTLFTLQPVRSYNWFSLFVEVFCGRQVVQAAKLVTPAARW